jgi:hypothetical protein
VQEWRVHLEPSGQGRGTEQCCQGTTEVCRTPKSRFLKKKAAFVTD